MAKILGISASLRNARLTSGSNLCSDLLEIKSKETLIKYLRDQGKLLVDSFLAENANGESYLLAFEKLRTRAKDQGLSNSEAALACGLWASIQKKCSIDYLSLSRHFPPNGEVKFQDELTSKILKADGLLISGPVYFGDRGSLVQSFIDFCHTNDEIKLHLQGKVYAGIAVGAKRNGGQETTLIYQMLDMANMGMLSVGNDTQTTSQYGGTAVAGDIGKLAEDNYGIDTCISTGNRIAHVAKIIKRKDSNISQPIIKIQMLVLQDNKNREGLSYFNKWAKKIGEIYPNVEITLWDALSQKVIRCIGCDICPIDVGKAEEYRCIISSKDDFFAKNHEQLYDSDAILVCAYNPGNRKDMISVYQQYMERTRYIRRDNYLYSDVLVAPFVISELSARQNMHLRIMTSMVRHQTIIHHPIIGIFNEGNFINEKTVSKYSENFIRTAIDIVGGRHKAESDLDNIYKPDGYVISREKTNIDIQTGKLQFFIDKKKQSMRIKRDKKIKGHIKL